MRRSTHRPSIAAEEVLMADTDTDQLGPIDYTVIEFPGSQFNGEVIPALNDLIAEGLVRILDVAFVAKDEDGNVLMAELEELGDLGPLAGLAGFLSDLVSEEDLLEVAAEMEPGNSAALLIWENRWAIPFIAAVRGSGGEFVASGRLAGAAILEALADDGATD
jgi:uncharacterized membrane protein